VNIARRRFSTGLPVHRWRSSSRFVRVDRQATDALAAIRLKATAALPDVLGKAHDLLREQHVAIKTDLYLRAADSP
jgi:hypothetical protein